MSDPPMDPVEEHNVGKVVQYIKDHTSFRSPNEFILDFYRSSSGSTSLKYVVGKRFTPERILDTWTSQVPKGQSTAELNKAITRKATEIMIQESTAAIRHKSLSISSSNLTVSHLLSESDSGFNKISALYMTLLPCLWFMLSALLTADNNYERWKGVQKQGKAEAASRIIVVVISILLHMRNRATDAFQLLMGIFLASSGGSRRVIDTFCHMGICVSYQTVQRALKSLSTDALQRARDFVNKSGRLFGVVYDNINFTNRKTAQRLDSLTEQINATTLAVFSFPKNFTRTAYEKALSILERNKLRGLRKNLKIEELLLSEEQQARAISAFKHGVRRILLEHAGGKLNRKKKLRRRIRQGIKNNKPKIRVLSHQKTEFFPLPALNEEEASVGGTIRVVERIFTTLLGLAVTIIPSELRLLVGDWLTIRNLRLMREERQDEFSPFERMDWIQEASMPFHFQLNAMYSLFRTHFNFPGASNPSSLDHHRQLLRRAKLDPKKPEYNKAKEVVVHSLIARVLDCARIELNFESTEDLKKWEPSWDDFDRIASKIVNNYTTSAAAHDALEKGDEVLAHSILFMRDALFFYEFCEAIQDADVGRMWVVYDFWVFMMRGAGCHNYGNEILEMKAQFMHELPPLLREVMERTWLVNRWGRKGRTIPTDLYLEHNNGFTKNMYAALGSCASIAYIQEKASACVEVLRAIAHDVTRWFGVRDDHRGHSQVSIEADIAALCLDISTTKLHTFTANRRVPPPPQTRKAKKQSRTTGVRDVLHDGREMLTEKNLWEQWRNRSGTGGTDIYGGDTEGGNVIGGDGVFTDSIFDDPDGAMDVDTSADPEFADECPFSYQSSPQDLLSRNPRDTYIREFGKMLPREVGP